MTTGLNSSLPTAGAFCAAAAISRCHLLALAVSHSVLVYDCITLRKVRVVETHSAPVVCVAWRHCALLSATAGGEAFVTDFVKGTYQELQLPTKDLETVLWVGEAVLYTTARGELGLVRGQLDAGKLASARWRKTVLNPAAECEVLLVSNTAAAVLRVDCDHFTRSRQSPLSLPRSNLIDADWASSNPSHLLLLFPTAIHVWSIESSRSLTVLETTAPSPLLFLLHSEQLDLMGLHEDLSCSQWTRDELKYRGNRPVIATASKDIVPTHAVAAPSSSGSKLPIAVVTSDLRLQFLVTENGRTRLRYCERLAVSCDIGEMTEDFLVLAKDNILQVVDYTKKLAFLAQIDALCVCGGEVIVAAGSALESCDIVTLRADNCVYQFRDRVTAVACSGLDLAVAEAGAVHLLRREAVGSPFTLLSSLPIQCQRLLWTQRFGVVCYGAASTCAIDPNDCEVLGEVDLCVSAVVGVDTRLVLGTPTGEVFLWDLISVEKTAVTGEIIGCVESTVVLHCASKIVTYRPGDGAVASIGTRRTEFVAGRGIAVAGDEILLFRPVPAVSVTGDSPALALCKQEYISPTPSSTVTPHFTIAPFQFDAAEKAPIPAAQGIEEQVPAAAERLLADSEETRFWEIVKQHEATMRRPNAPDLVSTLPLEAVKRCEYKGTPKSTSRMRTSAASKVRTPPRKAGKAVQTHTKNSFSTPGRAKLSPGPKVSKKTTATNSTAKLPTTSRANCQSERKTHPENDVFKLALDTSALLKTCFDTNRKRQVLASDGESQVADQLLDYSDIDGPASCKSDSPSPCGRKRSDSKTTADAVVTVVRQDEVCYCSPAVVCRELLGTAAHNPQFTTNIFKACVIAASVSPACYQATLYEAAQRLQECGDFPQAVELLCFGGRHAEACSVLQSHGRWEDSLSLARRFLPERHCRQVTAQWAAALCERGEFLEAVAVGAQHDQPQLIADVLQRWGRSDLVAAFSKWCEGVNNSSL